MQITNRSLSFLFLSRSKDLHKNHVLINQGRLLMIDYVVRLNIAIRLLKIFVVIL